MIEIRKIGVGQQSNYFVHIYFNIFLIFSVFFVCVFFLTSYAVLVYICMILNVPFIPTKAWLTN